MENKLIVDKFFYAVEEYNNVITKKKTLLRNSYKREKSRTVEFTWDGTKRVPVHTENLTSVFFTNDMKGLFYTILRRKLQGYTLFNIKAMDCSFREDGTIQTFKVQPRGFHYRDWADGDNEDIREVLQQFNNIIIQKDRIRTEISQIVNSI